MDDALKALAEPHRRSILYLVWDGEMSAGEISRHFDVSRPAVSQHLRVLRNAGLIEERPEGTRRYYRSRPEGTSEIRTFLEQYWKNSLGALKDAVESAGARPSVRQRRREKHGR